MTVSFSAMEFSQKGTYEEAVIAVQNSIAEDFGYYDWNDYLSKRDPEITEENGTYTIYDDNCGHEECYKIEKRAIVCSDLLVQTCTDFVE